MPRSVVLTLLFALALALPHGAARAQVRHCLAADGTRVFTDRHCEDIGASDYRAPPASADAARVPQNVCARSVQDLAYALDEAIRSGDANRIAALYDWAGMGTANAYRLMGRLDAIARRPLVDVQPMYAGNREDEYGYETPDPAGQPGEALRRPQLIGLRVEQTLSNGSTPSHAVFGLRRHLGCWWVRL